MARTLKDDEERKRRILLIGEYVKNTGSSTRETAKHFTRTFFPISNATVSAYCYRYMEMRPEEVDALRERITENTVKSVQDKDVAERVEKNADLFLEGLTVNEIAERTKVSFWTVYKDLTIRLKVLNPAKHIDVQEKLLENSIRNLRNVK